MNDYKRIPLKGLKNCRDLGGYACGDGKMVGYHFLYRSEAPTGLTQDDWKIVRDMGVKTIIDLRSESEQKTASYTVPEDMEQITYPLQQYDIPLSADPADREKMKKLAALAFGKSLADGYSRMVEDAPKRLVYLLELVAKGLEKGAVLYHCTAGKDRTGVLSALIYLLCGVDDADIIADYQVSAVYQDKNPMFDLVPEKMKSFLASEPETMEAFLRDVHQKDYLALLKENGLSEQTITWIREKITV